jgi:hypothetical protein
MSLWNDFLDTTKSLGKGLGAFTGSLLSPVLQAGASIGAGTIAKSRPEIAAAANLASEAGIKQSMKNAGILSQDQSIMKPVDPIMNVAQKAEEYVFSPIVARPISTAFLLADPNSPLYETEKFRKGFQPQDIVDAYSRTGDKYETINGQKVLVSKGVSLGVSLTKAQMIPVLPSLQAGILGLGGIDLDEVDLWNDQDVKENFQDNVVGKWVSGINDLIIKNVAIDKGVRGFAAITKSLLTAAGLSTKIRVGDINALPQLEKLADDHIKFKASNGQDGALTVFGQDIENLANSSNIIDITNILKPYTLNPRLPALVRETTDPAFVRDLLLADKGWGPAIDRLASARRLDDVWYMSRGTEEVQNYYIANNKLPTYTVEQRNRWNQAYDDAIAKDPKHQEIYDAFLKEELNPATNLLEVSPRFFGKNYKPMEPVIGKTAYAASRTRAGQLKTARLERDFSNVGGLTQTVLGGRVGGAATVLIRNFGTMMPKGFVTNSGLRPLNGVDELISVFDDIPLFRRGEKLIMTDELIPKTVSEYRRELIDKFVSATTDGARAKVIDDANIALARTIAYSRGYYNTEVIDSFVNTSMQNVKAVHGELRQHGNAMDPTGTRLVVNAQTQRQLQNSMPMLPFGELDKLIARAARAEKNVVAGTVQKTLGGTKDAAQSVFEMGNKAFSLAQLYRFSYIPKNSVFEPMLSATMASGSQFAEALVTTASKQMIKNTANFTMRNIEKAKTILPSAKKEIQREIKALSEEYNQAVNLRDKTYAQYLNFFRDTPGVSPKTKADWADEVREDLRAAEKVVENIETNFNRWTVEYGKPVDVPSIYNLSRRIKTLKDNIPSDELQSLRVKDITPGKEYKDTFKRIEQAYKGNASLIAKAEALVLEATNKINILAPELTVLDSQIAKVYDEIGEVLKKLDPKLQERARLFKVSEGRYESKSLMPETVTRVLANGQKVEFPSFTNENYLGDGYFSEIANNSTRTLEVLGNKAVVANINTIFRKSPSTITNVADPLYFPELTYVVNNYMRGDILVDQILSGASREELLQWATTRQGKSYAFNMGRSEDELTQIVDDSISYVNRYLPSPEAQRLAAAGAVKQTDLERTLSAYLDQMVPIQPLDIDYSKPTTIGKAIGEASDAAMSAAWRQLAKPENLIRQVWGNVEHANRVVDKANQLLAQGQEISLATLNALRQSTAAEMVQDITKVFYTIPRQQRGLYLARAALVFPNAAASGIYRYTGFAARQPGRTSGFLNSYYALYNSFGVDKYGNPVEDPMKAEYLLVPGTKEMGFNDGSGIIVSARATNFIANLPGPNWLVPLSVNRILNGKPNSADEIKTLVDKTIGKIPGYSYDELFPFGVEPSVKTQLTKTFTPAWARNLMTAVNKSKTDEMWMDSLISVANKQATLYEMKIGPKPTEKSIEKETTDIYLRKFRTQFFSLLGSAQYVEARPDSLFNDYYIMLLDKYKAQGKGDVEAQRLAEDEFQSHMAVFDSKFPMDRLFVSSRDKNAYITPSQKAYDRIWDDYSGLAKELESISPQVVGLLTADLPKEYSPQVNKFLNDPNTTLPGGTILNTQIKTPEMIEVELTKSRYWKAYTDYKNQLNDAAKDAQYASYLSVPELKELLKQYATTTLKAGSEDWYNEYMQSISKGDAAWSQARGLQKVVNNKKWMNEFGNTQFWTHAKSFLDYRDSYVKAYKDTPVGSKNKIQEQWVGYLESSLNLWDPVLQKIINRYFQNDNLKEAR